ncbi:CPBP family intramembrane glutamic endopeptidase [Marinoscillum pacificum]|uniref:CPBP family intramembrane glutamic endopeptidase n=1 Tax=Marinoscillum pacificum TaxID=392723 RepID=UPI00215845B1|nr:type II CAAX endopeptidase family protein [Marinoscillum pacificum]
MNSHYPTFLKSIGLILLYVLCGVVAVVISKGIPTEYQRLVEEIIGGVLFLTVALQLKYHFIDFRLYFTNTNAFNTKNLPIIIVFVSAYIVGFDPIISQLPLPESFKEILEYEIQKDWITYISVAVITPVLEELLFRKLILTGFAKNYGQVKGLILSSLLFAAFHMNLPQGVNAFFIGLFMGWIYLKTGNIWFPIFIHWLNNSIVMVAFIYTDDVFSITSDYLGEYQWLILMVISGVVMYLCVRILQRLFIPLEPCKEDQEETEPQEHLEI